LRENISIFILDYIKPKIVENKTKKGNKYILSVHEKKIGKRRLKKRDLIDNPVIRSL